ncbi:unnamed protein product [Natator depressus]
MAVAVFFGARYTRPEGTTLVNYPDRNSSQAVTSYLTPERERNTCEQKYATKIKHYINEPFLTPSPTSCLDDFLYIQLGLNTIAVLTIAFVFHSHIPAQHCVLLFLM